MSQSSPPTPVISQTTPARICILGGGFGGLYTALRLSQLPWETQPPEIILVDARDRFVFSPLLYEVLSGELAAWEVAPPYAELLAGTSIQFRQTTVAGVNIDAHQVQLQTGETITYDRLVLAVGGETPLDLVPGAADFAVPFRTLEDADRLAERLRQLEAQQPEKLRVAVIGGGYSGVELACKLADRFQNTLGRDRARIRIIEQGGQLLQASPTHNRDSAQKALDKREVWLDLETTVESITPAHLSLRYKGTVDTIPADLVLWTIGTRISDWVQQLPLKHGPRGQVLTSPSLQVVDHPEIFALGDLATVDDPMGNPLPATAQVAFQQSDYVGWNLWASLSDRPLLPFRYQPLGEMLTLGIDDATLSGLGINLSGPIAQTVRRFAYLNRMPTVQHQVRVGLSWLTRPIANWLGNFG